MLDAVPNSSANILLTRDIWSFGGMINEIMLVPFLKKKNVEKVIYILYVNSDTNNHSWKVMVSHGSVYFTIYWSQPKPPNKPYSWELWCWKKCIGIYMNYKLIIRWHKVQQVQTMNNMGRTWMNFMTQWYKDLVKFLLSLFVLNSEEWSKQKEVCEIKF